MIESSAIPKRFYSLDALRGIAAIIVVLTHWPQFFFVSEKLSGSPISHGSSEFITTYLESKLPFYDVLFVAYKSGWLAVDLFFGLSGFIFYWLYAEKIKESALTAWNFFISRFSRLYPLHLLTLIWIVCVQFVLQHATNASFFFFDHNDPFEFILHLLLISSWGVGNHVSFNLPIWSVSVEIAMYTMFFVLCRFFPVRSLVLAIVSAIGLFVVFRVNSQLGHGIASFFLGGCTYHVYEWIVKTSRTKAALFYLSIVTALLWGMAILSDYRHWDFLGSVPFLWRYTLLPTALIFQVTILTLALAETLRGTLGKRLMVLGDISYSVYLLHFPLQISALTMAIYLGISREVFYSYYAFFGFFAVVLTLAALSHYYFERPVQRYMRKAWQSPVS